MNMIKFNFNKMVTLQGNQVMTTSFKVTEYFVRRYADVLKAIKISDVLKNLQKEIFRFVFKSIIYRIISRNRFKND